MEVVQVPREIVGIADDVIVIAPLPQAFIGDEVGNSA